MRIRFDGSTLLAPLAIGMALAGCSRDLAEYEAYRDVRYSRGAARANAANSYLRRFPHGAHAQEISESVPAEDEAFWSRHQIRLADLREYLAEFPEGGHADEARFRIVTMYGGVVGAEQFATQRQSIDIALHTRAPDLVAEHWLRLVHAATSWNESLNAFYGANPAFARQFDESPVPICEPSGCTKTLDIGCAFAHADGAGEVMHQPFRIRMLSYAARVIGFDLFVSRRGAWLWNACTSNRAVEQLPPAGGESSVPIVDRLQMAVRALDRDAFDTPQALRPREIDRLGASALLPGTRGRYFWSLLVGCDTSGAPLEGRSCMRVDGYESTETDEVGVRAIAIPETILAAARERHAFDATATRPAAVAMSTGDSSASMAIDSEPAISSSTESRSTSFGGPAAEAVASQPNGTIGPIEITATTPTVARRDESRSRRAPNRLLTVLTVFGAFGAPVRIAMDTMGLISLGIGSPIGGMLLVPIGGPVYFAANTGSTGAGMPILFGSIAAFEVSVLTLTIVEAARSHGRRPPSSRALLVPVPFEGGGGVTFGATF